MKFLRNTLIALLLPALVWAQNIPLVINSGVPQQLPVANQLVNASGVPYGQMSGAFVLGHCLASGGGSLIVDSGVAGCTGGGGGGGTVTSVALTMPSFFTVTGSPITGAGTLAVTLNNQGINTFNAGPCSGSPAAPTYRAFCANDFNSGLNADTSHFWRGDLTWATIPTPTVEYPGAQCASPPSASIFTGSANVGSLSLSTVTQGIVISGTPVGSTDEASVWYYTAPSPPFSIYLRQASSFLYTSFGMFGGAGIALFDGSNHVVAEIVSNQLYAGTSVAEWWTTLSSSHAGQWTAVAGTNGWPWTRVDVTSTTWQAYVSIDGHNWVAYYGPHNISDQPGTIADIGVVVANNYSGGNDLIQCFSTTPPS